MPPINTLPCEHSPKVVQERRSESVVSMGGSKLLEGLTNELGPCFQLYAVWSSVAAILSSHDAISGTVCKNTGNLAMQHAEKISIYSVMLWLLSFIDLSSSWLRNFS
jgi:hypothetical protein